MLFIYLYVPTYKNILIVFKHINKYHLKILLNNKIFFKNPCILAIFLNTKYMTFFMYNLSNIK